MAVKFVPKRYSLGEIEALKKNPNVLEVQENRLLLTIEFRQQVYEAWITAKPRTRSIRHRGPSPSLPGTAGLRLPHSKQPAYSSSTSQSPSRFSCLQLLKLIFFSKSSESSEDFEKKGGEAPLLLCVPFRKLCPVFCAVCLSTVVGIGGFHDVIHMARFSVRYFLFVL